MSKWEVISAALVRKYSSRPPPSPNPNPNPNLLSGEGSFHLERYGLRGLGQSVPFPRYRHNQTRSDRETHYGKFRNLHVAPHPPASTCIRQHSQSHTCIHVSPHSHGILPTSTNHQPPTTNSQLTTHNPQPTTTNPQPTTTNLQPPTTTEGAAVSGYHHHRLQDSVAIPQSSADSNVSTMRACTYRISHIT
jgi:hypothetical protein